jgi:acylphosphatase
MTPPDDSNRAEIYVEGTRNVVEGFVRWCEKGSKNIGLSQVIAVTEVIKEEPTGLYDDFYAKTK